ncbi:hypothetical protein NXG27_13455 [Megasphaera paucivorans]|uniref:Uncharacterized protein n=1 Tax=Megasphaera paucivorans TaxID=349095 RepID=A0A1G9UED1_9FIRM|nr:hypothetical protein [Megasphaera paucivorans]SDM57895.1 hypothetical protein SAMN05660299_01152 [Megasphaera paucivorans]
MEKDLWQMIDEADAQNYGNLATHLKQDMEKSVQATVDKSPEPVRRDIGKASDTLYEKMDQFSQAEQEYAPSPETWLEYEPKHEVIKENLQNLQIVQEKTSSEQDIMTASDKTVDSFQQASIFLQTEYEKLVERERQVQREMEQIKHIIERMQEQTKGSSPENLRDLMAKGKTFISDTENLRESIHWQKPVIAAALWKEAREQVKQVYTGIQEMPDKIKTAVRDKAYSMMDQAIQKTSSIFDKGIQYLQSKKEEVLNLSPLEKRRQAVEKEQQEKLQTAEQQQSAVQRINEPEKGRTVASVQDKVSDNESNIKKPRKVLLRIESKGNVRSQEHERERSL